MKFYKLPDKYITGPLLLIAGLWVLIFVGPDMLYDHIGVNSWDRREAVITSNRLETIPGKTIPARILRWQYNVEATTYPGEYELPDSSQSWSTKLTPGSPISVYVNPRNPAANSLFCWNDLAWSGRILRLALWGLWIPAFAFGLYILWQAPKKPVIEVRYQKEVPRFSFRRHLLIPLMILAGSGVAALSAVLLEIGWHLLILMFCVILYVIAVRLLSPRRQPPAFTVPCSNPKCFSHLLNNDQTRAKAMATGICPACQAPLTLERPRPEHPVNPEDIPPPERVPRNNLAPHLLLFAWVVLLLPVGLGLKKLLPATQEGKMALAVIVLGSMMAAATLTPLLSFLLQKRRKPGAICPVCHTRFDFRKEITLIHETGNCPNCGATLLDPKDDRNRP